MARGSVKLTTFTTEEKSVGNLDYYDFEFREFPISYYWLPNSDNAKFFPWSSSRGFHVFCSFFFPVIVYPVEIAFKKRGPRITLEIGTHNPSYFGYQLRQDDGKETHKNVVCIDKLNKDQSKNCFYWFLIVVKFENGNI